MYARIITHIRTDSSHVRNQLGGTMKTLLEYGIEIEPGANRTLCPQCSPGRMKSYDLCLSVDQEQGVWFCHHCGWSGGTGGTKEDGEARAQKVFAKPHFRETGVTDKKCLQWLRDRGLSDGTIADAKLSSDISSFPGKKGAFENKACIKFPFFLDGEVVNVKYRTGDKRFKQEKGARKCFYNFDRAMLSTDERLYICEGEIDCLTLTECGYSAVVSVPDGAPSEGTATFKTKFDFLQGAEPLLERFKWVVLAVDGDGPGKRLEEELARRIGRDKCLKVNWPEGCKDANDVYLKRGKDILHQTLASAVFFAIEDVVAVEDVWSQFFAKRHNPDVGGVETGWDNCIGKFNIELGQMTVVTGIPSHGKSTWVDALRVRLWKDHQWPSAAFSPENWPVEDHIATLVEMYAIQNAQQMTDEDSAHYLNKLIGGFYFIQPGRDEDMLTVDEILNRAKSLVYQHGVKVLVIDPWNEIQHVLENGEREDQYISRMLAKIRRFARVNMVHVFLIVHPKQLLKDKDGKYPRPQAYDIAGGAMWRNKADNMLCVFRESMLNSTTIVFVDKIRFRRNGTAGAALRFNYHVGTSTYYAQGEDK